ncbi:MAG: hypothetical protein MUC49_08460 [Raineya sp.]|nr:hypothetical protein [Raineya sp.]
MQKIFLFSFLFLMSTKVCGQNNVEKFLSYFPTLEVGNSIGEMECKKALETRIPKEMIAQIDYKTLIYSNANDISKWDIMPVGKFKLKEGVYFVMYFSAISGANHTQTDYDYVLNTDVWDVNQSQKISTNEGNNAQYARVNFSRRKQLLEELGSNRKMVFGGSFIFKIVSPNKAMMYSYWLYSNKEEKKETYQFSWDENGSMKIE